MHVCLRRFSASSQPPRSAAESWRSRLMARGGGPQLSSDTRRSCDLATFILSSSLTEGGAGSSSGPGEGEASTGGGDISGGGGWLGDTNIGGGWLGDTNIGGGGGSAGETSSGGGGAGAGAGGGRLNEGGRGTASVLLVSAWRLVCNMSGVATDS